MPDVRVSNYLMERLGYGPSYTFPQMVVGAIMTELDGRKGLHLDDIDDDIAKEMGAELEACARSAIAGDGIVR